MSCSKANATPIALSIVDTQTSEGLPLAAGEVRCAVEANTRQLLFCAEDTEVRLTVKTVYVMNATPGWTLDLDPRRLGLPTVVLLAMAMWVFPLGDVLADLELSTWSTKVLLWFGMSLPILLRRNRQQLAIELAEDKGVIIVETHDTKATARLLKI